MGRPNHSNAAHVVVRCVSAVGYPVGYMAACSLGLLVALSGWENRDRLMEPHGGALVVTSMSRVVVVRCVSAVGYPVGYMAALRSASWWPSPVGRTGTG